MSSKLSPVAPLSQVVFVHDYVQLVFQDEVFSVYNIAKLVFRGVQISQGSPGFCDGLVNLIGQRAVQVEQAEQCALSLSFEGGASLHVLSSESAIRGPEAFQFAGRDNLLVVEQNA
ncbi:hypothetical protein [Niveibacterium microcysteis]|uniref:Uncharacterized protein n=1 Tax=Niveibacterium microcysteis TaxID=2811415 RepID=A0ABX7M5F9_9RHOO|nr:hypothetical protein [Niveibacterium microcysteis]QSI76661.1 hypothetical protein JY500_19720 [Niveibacterium microcysteis]